MIPPNWELCQHLDHVEPRVWTIAGGGIQVAMQCLTCGHRVGSALSQKQYDPAQLPPADIALRDAYDAQRSSNAEEFRLELSRALDRERFERRADYEAYIASPEWQSKRSAVLSRDGSRCQAQMFGCTRYATDVHHLSYEHFRNEPLFDLIAVCRMCHNQLHPWHDAGEVDDVA